MASRLSYLQARVLLLLLGMGIAGSQTLLAWERGAAPTEVLAPLLYIPVFVGAIFWLLPGGLIAAGLSSLIYGVLLAEQSAVIGIRPFVLLLTTRISFYFLFAVIVALGVRYIESRLHKLEIYDQIDDLTGLYNSSFFLQDTDLEVNRANRYQTLFSVVVLDVSRDAFATVSTRRYRRAIKDFARRIEDSVRHVDRAARADDGERDRFLIILPQTATEGAGIFAIRLQEAARAFFAERGCMVDETVSVQAITYPSEPQNLAHLRDEIASIEAGRRSVRNGVAS